MKQHKEGQWVLREVMYPQLAPVTAHMLEDGADPHMLKPMRTVRRVEALWVHDFGRDEKLFPALEDILDAVYACETRFFQPPDVIVTSLPNGSKIMGVEIR